MPEPALRQAASGWRWLLVGGCPRSGTTLLQLVLNTHPGIRLSNEVSLAGVLAALRPVFAREVAFDGWQERAKNHKENWTKQTLSPFIPRFAKCAGPMLRAMYEAQFADQVDLGGACYLGDKSPMYYDDDLDALEAAVGPLWLLHVSRNPIDVVNSMLRRSRNSKIDRDTWQLVHTIDDGCRHWVRAWNAVQQFSRTRAGRVVHVKYEDVVERTSSCLGEVAERLGVPNTFDTGRIVPDDPADRDLISEADAKLIDTLVDGVATHWSLPLDELGSLFPSLPEVKAPSQ